MLQDAYTQKTDLIKFDPYEIIQTQRARLPRPLEIFQRGHGKNHGQTMDHRNVVIRTASKDVIDMEKSIFANNH